MDSHEINGGPAFPFTPSDPREPGLPGMSLRDWFAGMAMQGLMYMVAHGSHGAADSHEGCAKEAYRLADAMLAEREKRHA